MFILEAVTISPPSPGWKKIEDFPCREYFLFRFLFNNFYIIFSLGFILVLAASYTVNIIRGVIKKTRMGLLLNHHAKGIFEGSSFLFDFTDEHWLKCYCNCYPSLSLESRRVALMYSALYTRYTIFLCSLCCEIKSTRERRTLAQVCVWSARM